MTHTYAAHFRIRQYELDTRDELPNSALLRLFQETAMRASQDAGYGVEWYAAHRSVWVIHRMTLEHVRPIHYPDELAITTWLSDAQRVRTHREYLARNTKTGEIVARGRAHWVHLDRDTLAPARIPTDIIESLAPNGIRALTRVEPRAYPLPADVPPRAFRTVRHVQRYEADAMQHVNNAVYLDWVEEALTDAIDALSLEPKQVQHAMHAGEESPGARRLCVWRHDIQYARSALPGEDVEIDVRLGGMGQSASEWRLEVKRGGEVLARDHTVCLWLDAAGHPVRWRLGRT